MNPEELRTFLLLRGVSSDIADKLYGTPCSVVYKLRGYIVLRKKAGVRDATRKRTETTGTVTAEIILLAEGRGAVQKREV